MYKRLRKNFLLITSISLLVVLGITMFALNLITRTKTNQVSDMLISAVYEAYTDKDNFNIDDLQLALKKFDESEITRDTPYKIRFFYVVYDNKDNIIEINTERIAEENEDNAIIIAERAKDIKKAKGDIDNYRFSINKIDGGEIAIFLDTVKDMHNKSFMLKSSLSIGIIISLLVFAIVFILSKKILKPFMDNEAKQKYFIADASHELKTPLSIISANTEMVEILNGESEWTESTKTQLDRMEKLIKNFITLSKSEETSVQTQEEVNLSELVTSICRDFKGRAEVSGKILKTEIQEDIKINADYEQIHQVINILIDNAIKYSQDDNVILVNLNKIRKTASLKIGNKREEFTKEDEKKIFNRFYRADNSRARETGGFGLGLSIASKIIESHSGKITTTYKNKWLFFNLEFPIV